MKKILDVIKTVAIITVLVISFNACDKDFTSIGTNLISANDHFNTDTISYDAISYNKKLAPVQTNNLASNLFGVYYDPIYGNTKASIVSQMVLSNVNSSTTFGVNVQLDSVVLTVPYFSHIDTDEPTNDDGKTNYILDSIYGNVATPIKLSIYKNNYFLNDYDPNSDFEARQKFYSNGQTSGGGTIPVPNDVSDLLYEDIAFIPSDEEIILTTPDIEDDEDEDDEVTGTFAPSFRVSLDNQFWQELILDKEGKSEISNPNNFKDYFRGLYFKVEDVSSGGSMLMFDFSSTQANITMYYKSVNAFDDEDGDGIPDDVDVNVNGTINGIDSDGDGINDDSDVDITEGEDINGDGIDDTAVFVNENTIVLNFTGNRVNIFDNNYTTIIDDANANANDITGDEKLYLKGGEGSMAIINLFGGVDSSEFIEFKSNQGDWIINEANLVFYEDETLTEDDGHEYDRLYVYDLKNNIPIVDYFLDISSTTSPIYSIINHLGQRIKDESDNYKFKIKITEHINNILLKDSTNTKLGLVLSTNVNSIQVGGIQGTTSMDDLNKVPVGAILSPKGTILYGNNTTNTNKKVKLEIFYTEPNN